MHPQERYELVPTEKLGHRAKILRIIGSRLSHARVVNPDSVLDRELHEQELVDARREINEFEPIRKDICESFGVPFDEEHIYIHDYFSSSTRQAKVQRALRAFFVVIDLSQREAFYGEGRIDHNTLFRGICDKASKIVPDMNFDFIVNELNKTPSRFLVFKGFLSVQDFEEISPGSRKILETPLFDEEHNIIKTPSNWFLTGHNLDDIS